MSDTRQAAEEELAAVGMTGDIEGDTLGASFSSSFSLPPPKAAPASESEHKEEASAPAPAFTEPEEELEDWRPEYDARLAAWQEESAIAREKAEKTRARIEAQRETERKASQGTDIKLAKQRKEEEARRTKLQQELEGRKVDARKAVDGGSAKEQAERGQKVKEAWEMVKKVGEPSSKDVNKSISQDVPPSDGRGVTAQDTNVRVAGETKPPIQPTMYDPTTSNEPIPPTMQDPSPSDTRSLPTGSTSQSRHSATSQAWEEISSGGSPSSAEDLSPPGSSSDELLDVPSSDNAFGRGMTEPTPRQISSTGLSSQDSKSSGPPAQPPSLTLSLFSQPSHLTPTRIIAVLGINLLLPFINGVMLGLGEIFARESLQVIGRKWWRNRRTTGSTLGGLGSGKSEENRWGEAGRHETSAGRGVGSVGLSGSGGFP